MRGSRIFYLNGNNKNMTIEEFIKGIELGAAAVIKNCEQIDAINVFPVPDSDTGSNMAKTLSGLNKLNLSDNTNSKNIFELLLNSTLENSQGNSGIMITAYLSGLLKSLTTASQIEDEDLLNGFLKAAAAARSSVTDPKAGTMLDAMDAFAAGFKDKNNVNEALKMTETALVDTESKMKVLSQNHVVDAGALGFTIFIYGFFGKTFDLKSIDATPVKKTKDKNFGEFPFEVVFIIKDSQFATAAIREILSPLGDSLDIVAAAGKIKVHIHTGQPKLVSETAQLFGEIENIVTVDMRKTDKVLHG